MPYQTINPQQAHDLMKSDPSHRYLDVRSVPEFEQGHPEGAFNVPIAHFGPGGMSGNPDFMSVISRRFPKDTPLLVGCKMGGRSARACEILVDHGYSNVRNVDGGFGGRSDANDPVARKGWQGAGLPVAQQPGPGATYAELEGPV